MSLKLVENWRDVLTKAWSLRLLAIAGLLTGIEAALSLVPSEYTFALPAWVWPVVTLLITAAAFVARLVAQDSIRK
jgi:hypothetical protein